MSLAYILYICLGCSGLFDSAMKDKYESKLKVGQNEWPGRKKAAADNAALVVFNQRVSLLHYQMLVRRQMWSNYYYQLL